MSILAFGDVRDLALHNVCNVPIGNSPLADLRCGKGIDARSGLPSFPTHVQIWSRCRGLCYADHRCVASCRTLRSMDLICINDRVIARLRCCLLTLLKCTTVHQACLSCRIIAGSDHTGSALAKASRVLFAQTSDARCSSGG